MSEVSTINEYTEALRKEIENLESVSFCDIYGGELDVDDLSDLKIDLRSKNKCHAFLDIAEVDFSKDNIHDKIFADIKFVVYVVGIFDKKTKGHSLDCVNCVSDILSYAAKNAEQLVRTQPGKTLIGQGSKIGNGIRSGKTFGIWYAPFSQRIRIK